MVAGASLESIKRECDAWFLKNYNLSLAEDWLKQCIEWLMSEYPNENKEEYRRLIYQQLLDFDLTEIGTKSLPQSLFNTPNGTFEGNYLLQFNYAIDASQSYYSQLQKISGDINENVLVNTDDNPFTQYSQFEPKSSNRLLTMEFTDGTNVIQAIEYRPIQMTNALQPGTKVVLQGKINYRQKSLILSTENLKILGGSVEELKERFSMLNILNMKLEEKCNAPGNRNQVRSFKGNETARPAATLTSNNYNSRDENRYDNHSIKSTASTSRLEVQKPKTEPPKSLQARPATTANFNNLNSNFSSNSYSNNNSGNYGGSNARNGSLSNPYLSKNDFQNKVFDDNSPSVIRRMGLETDDDEDDDFKEVKHVLGVGSVKVNKAAAVDDGDDIDDDELLMMDLNKVMETKKPQPVKQQAPHINKKETAKIKKELDFENDDEDWLLLGMASQTNSKNNENQSKSINNKIETKKPINVQVKKETEKPKIAEIVLSNDDFDDDDLLLLEAGFDTQIKPAKTVVKSEPNFGPKSELKKSYSALSDASLESSFDNARNQKKRIRLESEVEVNKVQIKDFKLVEVMDLMSLSIDESNHDKVFTIKGFIKTLTEPIKQSNMKWVQKCLISDGSYNLEIYIDNSIMVDMMKLTCEEAKILFQKLKKDPSLNQVYVDKCTECQQRLAHLSCVMYLKYDKALSTYVLIKLEELGQEFFDYLMQRAKNCLSKFNRKRNFY